MAGKVKCSACGGLSSPGRFCERCGQELVEQPAGQSAPPVEPSIQVPVVQDISPVPDIPTEAATGGRGKTETEPVMVPVEEEVECASCCTDLRLEYNAAQFFVDGVHTPFTFRITPLVEGISDMVLVMETDSNRSLEKKKRLRARWQKGRSSTHKINFKPDGVCGVISFDLYLSYLRDGQQQTFECGTEHKIYPSDTSAREVVDHIIVNIHNEVKTGHAADATIHNGLEQLQGLRDRTSEDAQARNLIDQIESLPPAFCRLELYPSTWQTPDHTVQRASCEEAPEGAVCERLTLEAGGFRYHLVAGEEWSLGRERKNDVVLRHLDGPVEKNRAISRSHCRMELHGERCFIKDGAFYPDQGITRESASGTFVNGKRLKGRGSAELPAGMASCVGLAGGGSQEERALLLDVCPVRCREDHTLCRMATGCTPDMISSVVVRRRDLIPELYLLLVRCADLGQVDPRLEGIRVWRQDGGFLASVSGSREWLQPGGMLWTGRARVECRAFEQWGIAPLRARR